jgi:cytochrome P450
LGSQESLRYLPVIGRFIPRVALQDLTLNGHFFPKGTVLFAAIHATHHHPDNWDRPEEFIPVPHRLQIPLATPLCLQIERACFA